MGLDLLVNLRRQLIDKLVEDPLRSYVGDTGDLVESDCKKVKELNASLVRMG